MLRLRLLPCLALLLGLGTAAAAPESGLAVTEAWIREGPPGVDTLAGFFVLHNRDRRPHVLVGVDSPRFRSVELHETRIDAQGVAHMVPLHDLTIPAGGSVRFAPGGRHLMLNGPRRPPVAGERIPVRLHFRDAPELRVAFPVRRSPPRPGGE